MSSAQESGIPLAKCSRCESYTYPAGVYGCRVCGSSGDFLSDAFSPVVPRLTNFVTVHTALAPGFQVPCIVGEIELAPGLIEEGLIKANDERELHCGLALCAEQIEDQAGERRWVFVPVPEDEQ